MNQKKPEFSVTEKLFIIMAWKVNGMSQGAAYDGWSDTYARKSAKEYWTDSTHQLQGWTFGIDDLQQVSSRDLKFLGFRQWEDETSMLLPLWLYPHMKKGETWNSLWGKPEELTDEFDLDIRGGCLACWFRHEPVPNVETIEALEDSRAGKVERTTLDEMFNDGLKYQPTETDPEKLIQNMEAEIWAASISGGEEIEQDEYLEGISNRLVHPHRDDEHQ